MMIIALFSNDYNVTKIASVLIRELKQHITLTYSCETMHYFMELEPTIIK